MSGANSPSLPTCVKTQLGFTPTFIETRFDTDGWTYEGCCRTVPCPACSKKPLEIWRKPYATFQYWGIVCPNCRTVSSQATFPEVSKTTLKRWSERKPIRLISWNINRSKEAWRSLGASDIDVALLQEASAPPKGVDPKVVGTPNWKTAGTKKRLYSTAIVQCSDRVDLVVDPTVKAVSTATDADLMTSQDGTFAVATMNSEHLNAPVVLVSAYSVWSRPAGGGWIYADASAHRLISDLSGLVGGGLFGRDEHRIIVAGDWNILYGYGEEGSTYWKGRYQTVFDRMEALELRFVGPQQPNGRAAKRPMDEEPAESLNVPTRRTSTPRGHRNNLAYRQLDFAFASESIADSLTVWALNAPQEWGPSDHCRILIEIDER
jgi:exonuclease III